MSDLKLGIFGGGQLGAMCATAARDLGVTPIVYQEAADSPASRAGAEIRQGKLTDTDKLRAFFAEAQTIAFENEFVDVGALRAATQGLSTRFYPSLEAIAVLQDKLSQKKLLGKLGIPTSEFIEVTSAEAALARFPEGCVLKWSRLGYDGKGVFFLAPDKAKEARAFFAEPQSKGIAVYAERRIAFKRELAIVAVRGRDAEFKVWPLVISEQQSGICRLVYGPAAALGVSSVIEAEAQAAARKLAGHLDLVGVFALELFETSDGHWLVNEIAPRVHNSGHYTMDASATSQFTNHVRAVLAMPLGETACAPSFAMLNLLGPEGVDRAEENAPLPDARAHGLALHWYGKSRIGPRRKVGHLNGTATSPATMKPLLDSLEECHNNWINVLRRS